MAIPRRVPVDFSTVFPYGAYAVGTVQPVRDYEKSTRDSVVQATDVDTGLLVWSVEVVDADPDAKKSTRTMSIKVHAKVQPVLPKALEGLPFTPIEFTGMTASPYIEENGDFRKIAWSFRATDVQEPRVKAPRPSSSDKAA